MTFPKPMQDFLALFIEHPIKLAAYGGACFMLGAFIF